MQGIAFTIFLGSVLLLILESASGTTSNGSVCRDKKKFCPRWGSKGFCNTDYKFHRRVRLLCPKSCAVCRDARVWKAGEENCKDTRPRRCLYWATEKNYCDPGARFYGYMYRNCRLACKFCKPKRIWKVPGTSEAPQPTSTRTEASSSGGRNQNNENRNRSKNRNRNMNRNRNNNRPKADSSNRKK